MRLNSAGGQVVFTFDSKKEYHNWLLEQRKLSWAEYDALVYRGDQCSDANNRCKRCEHLKVCKKLDDRMLNRAIKTDKNGLTNSQKIT